MFFLSFGKSYKVTEWVFWSLIVYFLIPMGVYLSVPFCISRKTVRRRTVSILVLGDLGHSPRMCYHALSFAKIGFAVSLCGYVETSLPASIIDDINIDVFAVRAIMNKWKLPYLFFAASKVFQQLFQLFRLLLDLRGSQYFMVQNPPSMPILAVVVMFIKIFSPRSKLIIDWHNLNYSILNLKYNNLSHPIVCLMRIYEKFFSRYGWLHITVTNKMREFLKSEFLDSEFMEKEDMNKDLEDFKKSLKKENVNPTQIITLYDRPGPQFEPLPCGKKMKVISEHDIFKSVPNIKEYKILVTATSFTPDENFDILLDALKIYHDSKFNSEMPSLFVMVTGKGPMKNQFSARVNSLKFSNKVIIKTAWLSSEDYPIILGVADLAVSLHTSSSGIDLPMKILDFFGVGVPVITLSFPAIGELVKDGINGLMTSAGSNTSEELSKLISRVMGDEKLLGVLRGGAIKESKNTWNDNWTQVLAPVVD